MPNVSMSRKKRAEKVASGESEYTLHGTHSAYTMGCHCAECTEATLEYKRQNRQARRAAIKAGEVEAPHGYRGYQLGCRCDECRIARGLAPSIRKLTRADVSVMKLDQAGLCGACGKETDLHVDHDHETGLVRGLLCIKCNTGLGKLGDSIESLEKALAYLKSPPAAVSFGNDVPLYRGQLGKAE